MNEVHEAPETIRRMLWATWALLDNLSPEQRRLAQHDMEDPSRLDWDFIPKPDRAGIPMWMLDRHQRSLAFVLLKTGLSMRGYTKALSIMQMENVLRELEEPAHGTIAGDFRYSDGYFFSFYGRPAFEDTWAWRVLGHHLSLSYTIVDQRYLTATPCNMGAQPAQAGVLAPLREDEELGFELLHSLGPEQRRQAVIHHRAPADYATRQVPRIGKVEYPDYVDLGIPSYQLDDADREALKFVKDQPVGISGASLTSTQSRTLLSLLECYLGRMPEEVAARQLERARDDGLEHLHFCWAGGTEPGTSHYYRVQGRQILIEFDNAIDSGNHIHSVWRDYRNDLGHELLLDHYERERKQGSHLRSRLESSVPDE
ncbi:MAG: DUF3500 domain-containing protein [Candidatus Dormibacteraeota bacterium]|nr:DUF3500 domain-containing protein [Candidatus Dormibacteraeota bacterium]